MVRRSLLLGERPQRVISIEMLGCVRFEQRLRLQPRVIHTWGLLRMDLVLLERGERNRDALSVWTQCQLLDAFGF